MTGCYCFGFYSAKFLGVIIFRRNVNLNTITLFNHHTMTLIIRSEEVRVYFFYQLIPGVYPTVTEVAM